MLSTLAVRTFKMPQSLNESLAKSQPPTSDANRSTESATKAEESFPKEVREPLSSHNPKHKPGVTFAAQDKLPKLPIPDLEHTLNKYLEALAPLQSGREHEETKAAVQEFLRTDGPELNDKLKKYSTGKSSYIEQFCKLHINACNVSNCLTHYHRVRFISQL
jgi:carnitine O-acetyltransferase